MDLQLLGRFQVRRDGQEVPPAAFGGRKVRTLLRVLAVRRPDLVPHEVLAEALWPDRLPADPVANLSVLVNRARRALGDPSLIVTGAGGYALAEACVVDVAEFFAAVERARAVGEDHAALVRSCTEALGLWGEPLAEDTYADWAREPRERLYRARVEACEWAARSALALGDVRRATAWAADAVAAEPMRESAVLVLARALAAAGDPAGALARLAELRARLREELGVDTSDEVSELQVALLRGEVRAVQRVAAPAPSPPRAFGDLDFVGRGDELARLHAAVVGHGIVSLAGTAGMGKSRLITELVSASPLPVVATVRAFIPERSEAWGLARSLLREALAVDTDLADRLPPRVRSALAGLLPELGDDHGATLDGESRRALLLAGGIRVLEAAAGKGALLVVDDLQWADASSLVLLGSVLARVPNLAAVLAFRPDECPPQTLSELTGTRSRTDIVLAPLPAEAIGRLVMHPDLTRAVLDATDRTPFAVAELLRELANRDALIPAASGGWAPRTPDAVGLAVDLGLSGQRRAVERRAERQTGPRGEVLALLALLAREAPASTLAAATGLDGRSALDALSSLASVGLARLGEQGWATAHDLVSETVTASLARGERGRLHGLLSAALAAEDADPAEIARHQRDAGDTVEAARTFAVAAERALNAQATREAVELADAGLVLDPRAGVRSDLLAVRAESGAVHGEPSAIADLTAAIAVTDTASVRSRRLSRLAMLTFGARDPERASELVELALVEAGGEGPAQALALETAAILDMNLGRPTRAGERAEAALGLYRGLADARGVARILDGRAMATFLDGRISDGVEVFGRVAQLLTDSGELLRVVTPRSTRGHGLVFMARAGEGLVETSAAVQLARELDAPESQAYALWHRSEALSGLGRAAEAESDAREALTIARTLGHRGWTATAYRALGIALTGRGELDDAAAAFTASASAAGDSLTLFAAWAAARSALTAIARGALAGVDSLVTRALIVGPPLGHYEARLAEVELLAARDDPITPERAATALGLACDSGHNASIPRLAELAGRAGTPTA